MKKKLIWGLGVFITILACCFSFFFYNHAFPIISLNLTTNRTDILNKSAQVLDQYHWQDHEFSHAISFDLDDDFKNYVELRAGGATAFIKSMDWYASYQWSVRYFKQGSKREVILQFTPQGELYGLKREFPDEMPGAKLALSTALQIGLTQLKDIFKIDTTQWTLVEQSQESKISGRIDHTLVFENNNQLIKDAPYRIRVMISGDTLSEVTRYVQLPEKFAREYREIRSSNTSIAFFSQVLMIIFYLIGACVIGIYLFRKKNLIFKSAILWAVIISGAQWITSFNNWPLIWMGYDTALSPWSFILQYLLSNGLMFLMWVGIFGFIFTAAEGITRFNFTQKFQFWKTWNPKLGGSMPIITQTLIGYAVALFHLAYVIGFYFIATKYFKWWTPAETMIDPNMMATYLPFLNPFANALEAGFVEEFLFRAVPLGGALFIANRFKWPKKPWLIGAFIFQVLIFSTAHAFYASFPAYSRVIELIIPSTIFGLLYLTFGLYPGIIAHFVYDGLLMAMPIFFASGFIFNKLFSLGLILFPLILVSIYYIRQRHQKSRLLPFLNISWKPKNKSFKFVFIELKSKIPSFAIGSMVGIGIVGLVLFALCSVWKPDIPGLSMTREKAVNESKKQLFIEKRFSVISPWVLIPTIEFPCSDAHFFIWQTQRNQYRNLLFSGYLNKPSWLIQVKQFSGKSVAERAEEYQVGINETSVQVIHRIPEATKQPSLDRFSAKQMAYRSVRSSFSDIPSQNLKINTVEQFKRPNRIDWEITFLDRTIPLLQLAESRIKVVITGNEVASIEKYIYIPEKWTRHVRELNARMDLIRFSSYAVIILIMVYGVVRSLIQIKDRKTLKKWILLGLTIFGIGLINMANQWPKLMSHFVTDQPFSHQIARMIGSICLGQLLLAIVIASLWILMWPKIKMSNEHKRGSWIYGVSGGCLILGFFAIRQYLSHSVGPFWVDLDSLNHYFSWFAILSKIIINFAIITAFLLIVVDSLNQVWYGLNAYYRWLIIPLILGLGAVFAGYLSPETLSIWAIESLLLSSLISIFLLTQIRLWVIPIMIAWWLMITQLKLCFYLAYPYAVMDSLIVVLLLGVGFTTLFYNRGK